MRKVISNEEPMVFNYKKVIDERGSLIKLSDNNQIGYDGEKIIDLYIAESNKNVFRGLHYQYGKFAQRKNFLVLNGKVDIYCYNLRTNKIMSFELSRTSKSSLYVPIGWATGYHAKSNKNQILYASPDPYVPSSEKVINCSVIDGLDYSDLIFSDKDKPE